MMNNAEMISVGKIVNTQGHKGEVRVWPLTDFPERFKVDDVLTAELNQQTYMLTIESVRPHKNFLVMKFKEIQDMNAAESMKNADLKISQDMLVNLPENTFFVFELIGMKVYTDEGLLLGQVKDVIQTGSNDVYIVKGETKEYMIPALKDVVQVIDKEKQEMMIKPLEGLLDL